MPSWVESRLISVASAWACSVRALRAAVEVGSAAMSCQAFQYLLMVLPRPESDGSGKMASILASSCWRVSHSPCRPVCAWTWRSRKLSRMRVIEATLTPDPIWPGQAAAVERRVRVRRRRRRGRLAGGSNRACWRWRRCGPPYRAAAGPLAAPRRRCRVRRMASSWLTLPDPRRPARERSCSRPPSCPDRLDRRRAEAHESGVDRPGLLDEVRVAAGRGGELLRAGRVSGWRAAPRGPRRSEVSAKPPDFLDECARPARWSSRGRRGRGAVSASATPSEAATRRSGQTPGRRASARVRTSRSRGGCPRCRRARRRPARTSRPWCLGSLEPRPRH